MRLTKPIGYLAVLTVVLTSTFNGSVVMAQDISSQTTPGSPTHLMADMQKSPDFGKPVTPTEKLPESELTHILFSHDWLISNDADPDPNAIKITFPKSWTQETPLVKDTPIELIVPTRLLNSSNTSINSNEMTVTFPTRYFKGLPIVPNTSNTKNSASATGGVYAVDNIEYQEALGYDASNGDNITGAWGDVTPYYYSNSGESFWVYHEIEFHTNHDPRPGFDDPYYDTFEIVSVMGSQTTTRVFVAVYRDGQWATAPSFLSINVNFGDCIGYQFMIESWGWACYFQDTSYNWYYNSLTDSTPPSRLIYIAGSAEIDTMGGISNDFMAETYPLTVKGLETNGSSWQTASYISQRFSDTRKWTQYAQYASVSGTLNLSGLSFCEYDSPYV